MDANHHLLEDSSADCAGMWKYNEFYAADMLAAYFLIN